LNADRRRPGNQGIVQVNIPQQLGGLFKATPSTIGPTIRSFGALQKLMTTDFDDLQKEIVSSIFNILQSQYGQQHFKILPQRDGERTVDVNIDVGAIRQWILDNNRLPDADEWTNNIITFRQQVADRMDEFPAKYIPFED